MEDFKETQLPSFPTDLFDDDELEAVNAIRRRTGMPPFKKGNFRRPNCNNGNGNRSNRNGNNNGNISCRYCKKKGQMQRECKSDLRDNAPMVDIASVMLTEKRTGLNWL